MRSGLGLAFFFLSSLLGLPACWVPVGVDFLEVQAKLDPKLTPVERAVLEKDLVRFLEVSLGNYAQPMYRALFGGDDLAAVTVFLNERVNYVLSSTRATDELMQSERHQARTKGQVQAFNIGAHYFLKSLGAVLNGEDSYQFEDFYGARIPIRSSRLGVIQLGEVYQSEEFLAREGDSLRRMGVWVHEARHSDCTGGLNSGDYDRLAQGLLPASKGCTHLHEACPKGTIYGGILACDLHPWGAYFVGATYHAAIAFNCRGCSESEKQTAMMAQVDNLAKIEPRLLDDMLSGRLGAPDLSHQEVIF